MTTTADTNTTTLMEVDFTDHGDGDSSLFNPAYTYSNDKYSCVQSFYFFHLTCAYLVFLTGLGCLLTRILPARFRCWHAWLGRCYIISMLWCTLTSLLIHNTGLPLSTLISFTAIMICLSLGWIVIVLYREGMDKAATSLVSNRLNKTSSSSSANDEGKGEDATTNMNLHEMIANAKMEIATNTTFVERFFSLKTLHGVLFFVSWFQFAGRIFSSNQSGDFTCHTYPVYKPIDTNHGNFSMTSGAPLTIVPESDPDYDSLPWAALGPWAWTLSIIFGSMVAALVTGAIWNYADVAKARAMAAQQQQQQQEQR
jgi:hypothetical protein